MTILWLSSELVDFFSFWAIACYQLTSKVELSYYILPVENFFSPEEIATKMFGFLHVFDAFFHWLPLPPILLVIRDRSYATASNGLCLPGKSWAPGVQKKGLTTGYHWPPEPLVGYANSFPEQFLLQQAPSSPNFPNTLLWILVSCRWLFLWKFRKMFASSVHYIMSYIKKV